MKERKMPVSDEDMVAWAEWRNQVNGMHRVMTAGEYAAWIRGGDSVSHPSSTKALRGGITILLGTPPVIGLVRAENGELEQAPMPPVIGN